MSILVAHELRKHFGQGSGQVEALRGVDLLIDRGELLSIMGPSGSGKSTLLHLLGGIELPSSGRVLLESVDLTALGDDERTLIRRRRLGFVFQSFNLLPPISVEDNVALPLLLDGVAHAEAHRRAVAALELVEMSHRRNHLPGTLSGGEQQRSAIARALVIEPAVVLADEPTGNLDSTNGQIVMSLLQNLVDHRHVTVVIITHDPDIARQTHRVIRIRDGRVESDGDPSTASLSFSTAAAAHKSIASR